MKKILFLVTLFITFSLNIFSQIRIKEIASELPSNIEEYSNSETRKIIPLNKNWTFEVQDSDANVVAINVPSTYSSNEVLILKRKIDLTNFGFSNSRLILHFLGISNTADIFFNDVLINKMSGGNIPFDVEIPSDLILANEDNLLRIVLSTNLDSKNSIPLAQRFLFPKNSGGIVRDVYLEILPVESLKLDNFSIQISNNLKSSEVSFALTKLINFAENNNDYFVEISFTNENGKIISKREKISLSNNMELFTVEVNNPKLWSLENPFRYNFEFKLYKNEQIIDVFRKKIAFAQLENTLEGTVLNKSQIKFSGVTYIHSSKELGTLTAYSELKKDLEVIKALGMNSVRFAKSTPHPFALQICEEIGLIPFIEMPLNSPPEQIVEDENFIARSERFFQNFVESYSNYTSIMAIGVGSGYTANCTIHESFIKKLAKIGADNSNALFYASFNFLPKNKIAGIDYYGLEVFNNLDQINESVVSSSIKKNIFISEATYPNYVGNSNGYLNKFSYEAQAKYFEQIIENSKTEKFTGFFINSMFDYYGDFSSLYSKYNNDNLYQIGILGTDEEVTSPGYKAIKSKLSKSQRVTIPVGSSKEDSPMFFIIVGLVLSVLMGILINSKKKLREDATRALIRPYNFFADIRDHRIISGFATIFLMLILAGSHSLLVSNILFYLKNSILFEKILLSFGLPSLISLINYLSWNPYEAFAFFLVTSIIFFLFLSVLIFVSSFFIRIKIYFMSIFYTVIWATLPLALTLPIKMVLYRILLLEEFNLFIFGFLVVYFFWIAKRIITGVYVIFDIGAGRAYLYSLIVATIIMGSFFIYFQVYHSTIYYIINAFNQFNLF